MVVMCRCVSNCCTLFFLEFSFLSAEKTRIFWVHCTSYFLQCITSATLRGMLGHSVLSTDSHEPPCFNLNLRDQTYQANYRKEVLSMDVNFIEPKTGGM